METNPLLKYCQSPYVIIGLDLNKTNSLSQLNNEESFEIKQIFDSFDDCEDFIKNQINDDDKLILILNDNLLDEQLIKIENYSQINAIYLCSQEEFKCIYRKIKKKIFIKLLKNFWFILSLLISLLFAYLFPKLGSSDGPLHTEYTIKWGCVILIFFLSGLSLSTNNLLDQIFEIRLHILIQTFSFLLFPSVIYGISFLLIKLSLNKLLINGIIVMSCTSTAISTSVIMTKNAGGNEGISLLNGLIGNILGIFISPALIYLFMNNSLFEIVKQKHDIDNYINVISKLSLTVLLPLIIGQIIHRIWKEKILWAKNKFYFTEINSLVLLILVWSILCNLFQSKLLSTINNIDLIILILLNTFIYFFFSFLSLFISRLPNLFICRNQKQIKFIQRWRFSHENTIAFMFSSSTKTLAQGIPLITSVFANSSQGFIGILTIPLILYFVQQLIFASIQVIFLKRWIKRYYSNKNELINSPNIVTNI
ncbi:unnamed protein product [Adineta steineri]|uniref:Uncharacterized protein n=3 Tax=Adineta steineri TaxID=433720 RepID=A0A815BDM0_9BILA|nr:unnamed protein product [Adineta steineri]CAF1269958.1 unnamed protein product [Adineta steineri]CAF4048268.1 unnamed protein product [Adineta steineri]